MSSADLVPARTGEQIALTEAPTDVLADTLLFLKERVNATREYTDAVTRELAERLRHENRKTATVGDYTITALSGRSREWDAGDLEAVLEDLVARNVISPAAAVDVIQRTVKVSGMAAMRLAGNLDGEDRAQVEACAKWKSGRPSVKVERTGLHE